MPLVVLCLGCTQQPISPVQATPPTGAEPSPASTPEAIEVVIADDTGFEPVLEPEPELTIKPLVVWVKQNRPEQYIVKKGDTLWAIAERFFDNPWVRTTLWKRNPQIQNPHLIYPGDAISVVYIGGQAHLQIDGESGAHSLNLGDGEVQRAPTEPAQQQTSRKPTARKPTVKLTPRLRRQAHKQTTQLVAANTVEQFTDLPQVLSQQQLESAAYVVGNFDSRVLSTSGNTIYARGITDQGEALYSIFRYAKPLIDPESKEVLGQEMVFIADAKVSAFGNPSTLLITKSKRETLVGDILLPFDRSGFSNNYTLTAPERPFKGTIISLFNALAHAARNQVITINLGQRDGLERGHLLRLEKQGGTIRDTVSTSIHNTVALPDTRLGVAMIFKTFEKVSYGLIMQSTRAVSVGDIATNLWQVYLKQAKE